MTFAQFKRHRDLPLSHVRLIAVALLAVLLPAVTLLILQYRSLSDVEQKTRIAVQEHLRNAAEGVAWSIQGDMERAAEKILLPVPAEVFGQKQPPWTLECAHEIFQKHPEINELFLVLNDPQKAVCNNAAYIYKADKISRWEKSKWEDIPGVEEAIAAHEKGDLLFIATAPGARSRFCYWQDLPQNNGESNRPEASYVSYCLLEPKTGREVGFVGMRLDMEEIRNHYLPQMVSTLSSTAKHGPGSADLVLEILDQRGKHISSSAPGTARYAAHASLAPVFPQWEATAGFQTTDIDALAHASFQKGLWFTLLVAAVLLAGTAMIVRASARELKLAEAKQTFVSNVSHELKTPLALIRLFAETLELGRAKTDGRAQEYYRIIHNESRRLSQLIDNILDFSRIEAGSREYKFGRANLADVTREVVERYEYQICAARFELETQFDLNLPWVEADWDAISQAILNLLNNAVKYSDRTRRIFVRVRAMEGGTAVEIADQGIGIPLPEQKRIFEKFYRVSTGLVHETKGSGLGLALVKHIVEAHHGRVLVVSAPGKGSRFTLWLPAAAEEVGRGNGTMEEGDLLAQSLDHRG